MTGPKRIQRKRTKGWRMPEGAVYVGRPTKWGNPWTVGHAVYENLTGVMSGSGVGFYAANDERWFDIERMVQLSAENAVWLYRTDLEARLNDPGWLAETDLEEALDGLAGKDLVCWCPLDQPCHADVLLEIANT